MRRRRRPPPSWRRRPSSWKRPAAEGDLQDRVGEQLDLLQVRAGGVQEQLIETVVREPLDRLPHGRRCDRDTAVQLPAVVTVVVAQVIGGHLRRVIAQGEVAEPDDNAAQMATDYL